VQQKLCKVHVSRNEEVRIPKRSRSSWKRSSYCEELLLAHVFCPFAKRRASSHSQKEEGPCAEKSVKCLAISRERERQKPFKKKYEIQNQRKERCDQTHCEGSPKRLCHQRKKGKAQWKSEYHRGDVLPKLWNCFNIAHVLYATVKQENW
jgi:hypothetical protein